MVNKIPPIAIPNQFDETYTCPYANVSFSGPCKNTACPAHAERCGAVHKSQCWWNVLKRPVVDAQDISYILKVDVDKATKKIRRSNKLLTRVTALLTFAMESGVPKSIPTCVNCGYPSHKPCADDACKARQALLTELAEYKAFAGLTRSEIWMALIGIKTYGRVEQTSKIIGVKSQLLTRALNLIKER